MRAPGLFGGDDVIKMLLPFAALCALPLGPTAIAAPIAPDKMLVASTPAEGDMPKDRVETISLKFAETVELLNVSLIAPDGGEQQVFAASFEPDAPKTKGRDFDFLLATPVTALGRYSLSYLLTSKSIKSLNGYVYFEIVGQVAETVPVSDVVAPDLIEAIPAERSTVDEPVADIALKFGRPVRLMQVTLITPDQNSFVLNDKANAGEAKTGSQFALVFPQPVTLPGTYLIDYTVHQQDEGGVWFETSAYSSFMIADPTVATGEGLN